MKDRDNNPGSESGPNAQTAALVHVGHESDLPEGRCATIQLEDDEVALFKVDGRIYAISSACPHKGASLAQSPRDGYVIECNWHGWQFDIRDGACLTTSCPVPTYEVVIKDGEIMLAT